MRELILLAAVALVAGTGPAWASPDVAPNPALCPGDVADPAVLAFYPGPARAAGVEGKVGVTCALSPRGAVAGCKVDAEWPAGQGFGTAALAMLAASRDNPAISLTAAQTAQPVTFTVDFSLRPLGVAPNLIGRARRVELPVWRELPSAADIDHAYPLRSASAFKGGVAMVDCAVHRNSTVYDCKVASETPAGEGFGAHALDLIDRVRIDPAKCDGLPAEGSRVLIPVTFKPGAPTIRPH